MSEQLRYVALRYAALRSQLEARLDDVDVALRYVHLLLERLESTDVTVGVHHEIDIRDVRHILGATFRRLSDSIDVTPPMPGTPGHTIGTREPSAALRFEGARPTATAEGAALHQEDHDATDTVTEPTATTEGAALHQEDHDVTEAL